ncbi:MAG TPA: carboxypeptidase-like regulatory domain-containing protein [Hymenobacter sp.]|jgi:hypothetical protein|uniref:carboxypeptidase-like regulatory domain-containing protein n=1 Tax=Hymenobacter sp. TaxID=1898978 RepID=UPI002ED87727
MRTPVLQIPQPCNESWDAMSPVSTGRHCAACHKTVVDFTHQTDAEILAYLARASGTRTCGRFAAGQLERPLQRAAPAAPTASWRAWLAAAVAVWGVREGVSASVQAQAPIEMHELRKAAAPEHIQASRKPDYEGTAQPLIIRGTVFDWTSREGLPGATVLIKNTRVGLSTAADGSFELSVPAEYATSGTVVLQISFVGFVTAERQVACSGKLSPLQITLQADMKGELSGDVVIVGGRRPWPWHPRAFYQWSKYWVTRPFQRA